MDKTSLYRLIQDAASQQEQELSWVGNLYRSRLKELQEANKRWHEYSESVHLEGSQQPSNEGATQV